MRVAVNVSSWVLVLSGSFFVLVGALGLLGLSADDVSRGLDILHEAHEEVAAAKRQLTG